jgi:hypothetical protein
LCAKSGKSKSFLLKGFNEYSKTLGEFDADKQRLHTLIVKNHMLDMVRARLPVGRSAQLHDPTRDLV